MLWQDIMPFIKKRKKQLVSGVDLLFTHYHRLTLLMKGDCTFSKHVRTKRLRA